MEKEVLRTINKMEEMKWITINPNLNKEAIAQLFIEILKEIKLKDYINLFTPRF